MAADFNNTLRRPQPQDIGHLTAWVQGSYYLATGVWPLIDIKSFEMVTGPKYDKWLVKTVGGLVAVVGSILLWSAARRKPIAPELKLVAAGCAAALMAVEVAYVARRRISPIYLADAVTGVVLMAGWAVSAGEKAQA